MLNPNCLEEPERLFLVNALSYWRHPRGGQPLFADQRELHRTVDIWESFVRLESAAFPNLAEEMFKAVRELVSTRVELGTSHVNHILSSSLRTLKPACETFCAKLLWYTDRSKYQDFKSHRRGLGNYIEHLEKKFLTSEARKRDRCRPDRPSDAVEGASSLELAILDIVDARNRLAHGTGAMTDTDARVWESVVVFMLALVWQNTELFLRLLADDVSAQMGGTHSVMFDPEDCLSGLWLPPLWIGQKHGAGTMGVVYKAYDTSACELCAVKFVTNDEYSRRLQRETFVLRRLAGTEVDHVVRLRSFGTDNRVGFYLGDGDGYYLAMDFVPGIDLAQLLRRGALRIDAALAIVHQLGLALSASHAKGIIHKDVKPSNVRVRLTSEGRLYVTLIDFGVAHVEKEDRLTRDLMSGTAAYMCPRYRAGDAEPSPQTDLYSLGILLVELLTTEPHFGHDFAEGLAGDREVIVAVRSLLASFAHPDPARRPPSADAALDRIAALTAMLAERGVAPLEFGRRAASTPGEVITALEDVGAIVQRDARQLWPAAQFAAVDPAPVPRPGLAEDSFLDDEQQRIVERTLRSRFRTRSQAGWSALRRSVAPLLVGVLLGSAGTAVFNWFRSQPPELPRTAYDELESWVKVLGLPKGDRAKTE